MELEKVKEILSSQFGVDIESIDESTDIIDDLGADSLDVVELIMSLEEEFGLLITDEMAKDVKTVGELVKLLDDMLENE